MTATIIHGDCLDVLRGMADASVDAVVTDPPYELAFMGRKWDASGIAYNVDLWREVLRVLKPGGHLLAFGGTRTYHRMTCAIEDAGAEIRDCITWHYGQGFPKSHNIGGGLGTALKPSTEPIVVARRPLVGTVAANVAQHGTGAINVDGCRVDSGPPRTTHKDGHRSTANRGMWQAGNGGGLHAFEHEVPSGRWPPNLLLTHSADCGDSCADDCPVAMMDRQSGQSTSPPVGSVARLKRPASAHTVSLPPMDLPNGYGDSGGASRFFPTFDAEPFLYQAKASKRDRGDGNRHPTVKPTALMQWLVRLVTPPGGVILDPFAGSGTTLVAALAEGRQAIGIEREAEYVEIIKQRVAKAEAA